MFSVVLRLGLFWLASARVSTGFAEPSSDAPDGSLSMVVEGQRVSFLAEVGAGTPPFLYQWSKNNTPIADADSALLVFASVRPEDAGTYTVTVTNSYGTATSMATPLNVRALRPGRISNISIVASSPDALIVGFAVGGPHTQGNAHLLARAAGPALGQFGVTGTMADPVLNVFDANRVVASNDNWGGDPFLVATFASVGSFPFAPAGKDAALVFSPPAKNYSATISDATGGGGTAGVELYDLEPNDALPHPRLVNVSARALTGKGRARLIAGFTIEGERPVTLLLRGIGPSLTQFGVVGALEHPRLTLFKNAAAIGTNARWADTNATAITAAGEAAGAFSLQPDTLDAALLTTLAPGSYTAELADAGDSVGGTALIEVYQVNE